MHGKVRIGVQRVGDILLLGFTDGCVHGNLDGVDWAVVLGNDEIVMGARSILPWILPINKRSSFGLCQGRQRQRSVPAFSCAPGTKAAKTPVLPLGRGQLPPLAAGLINLALAEVVLKNKLFLQAVATLCHCLGGEAAVDGDLKAVNRISEVVELVKFL
jgi:hypothetical protein